MLHNLIRWLHRFKHVEILLNFKDFGRPHWRMSSIMVKFRQLRLRNMSHSLACTHWTAQTDAVSSNQFEEAIEATLQKFNKFIVCVLSCVDVKSGFKDCFGGSVVHLIWCSCCDWSVSVCLFEIMLCCVSVSVLSPERTSFKHFRLFVCLFFLSVCLEWDAVLRHKRVCLLKEK